MQLKDNQKKDMEQNIIIMEIDMKENGKMVIEKDMEYYIIMMGINMKENGKIIIKKDMEYIILIMEIDMKENLKMIYLMVMVIFMFKIKDYIQNMKIIKVLNLY